jgi:hypothetical protein
MENDILILKPAAQPVEQGGRFGLLLDGRARYASSPEQALLLRALLEGRQPVWRLTALLAGSPAPAPDETRAALALAGFILDFNDYLEA